MARKKGPEQSDAETAAKLLTQVEAESEIVAPNDFDIGDYAAEVKPRIATYEELMRDKAPEFKRLVAGLPERVRQAKELRAEKVVGAEAKARVLNDLKVLVVIGTGGTFQSEPTPRGYEPTGTLKESFDALGLPEDPAVHLELMDLMNLDSSQLTIDQWRFLAEMIQHLEDEVSNSYDELIITHGTDTMANAAAYLSLMLKGFPKSIIITGSQEAARKKDTDAKDQMDRTITAAKIAHGTSRRICETLVCCGLRVTRGTWATKQGDTTVDVFGPWNQPQQGFDATDWNRAAANGTLHRIAPALMDFGIGKSRGSMEYAGHAIDYDHKGPYEPFTGIKDQAGIIPVTLTDIPNADFARHIKGQRVNMWTQLGSATAKDELIDIGLQAVEHGKIGFFEAAFHDSETKVGKYSAGAEAARELPNLQRPLPVVNTSPITIRAKANYLLNRLGIEPAGETPGLGVYYSDSDLRKFLDHIEQNMVGELV